MKAALVRESESESGDRLPAGTVIDHPDAWRLVEMGSADPADAECLAKCVSLGLSGERLAKAKAAYERSDRGIHPEDFEAYAAGWMIGYQKTDDEPRRDAIGNTSNIWEPGPKFAEYQALLDARQNELVEDEEDDEDGEDVAD